MPKSSNPDDCVSNDVVDEASTMPKSSSGASAAHASNTQNQRSEDTYVVPAAVSADSDAFANVVIPQNPGLAENTYGSPHCDSYCSESANTTGPNSTMLRVIRQRNPYGVTFVMVSNKHDQMIGISLDWSKGTFNLVIYSKHLELLSVTHVETKTGGVGGGGYFFLDNTDFTIVGRYNLLCAFDTTYIESNTGTGDTNSLPEVWTSDDLLDDVFGAGTQNAIHSALPVWGQPNHYYVLYTGKYDIPNRKYYSPCGISVVKIIPDTSKPNGCVTTIMDSVVLPLEWNNNTFAVDETGAYFVTNVVSDEVGTPADYGLFRKVSFDASTGKMTQEYKTAYKNSGLLKPGQNNIGSGATPTLVNGTRKLAVITDNDSPRMNVLTYDRATGEEVSSTPVFPSMRGAGEASLIGVGDMWVVENNYGHLNTYPYSQLHPNEPGLTRIDMKDGAASETWTDDHTSFLAMSMLARKTGCIFAHTADWSGPDSATKGAMYYINAIDAMSGRIIWRVPMGRGVEFCHDFGGIYFNREGSLFVGTANYVVSVQNE